MVGGDIFCGYWGVNALVMDFKEVMQTSPTELAHCGRGLGLGLASGVLGLASGELEKPKGRVGR